MPVTTNTTQQRPLIRMPRIALQYRKPMQPTRMPATRWLRQPHPMPGTRTLRMPGMDNTLRHRQLPQPIHMRAMPCLPYRRLIPMPGTPCPPRKRRTSRFPH